jgi:hypothetical protein
VVSQASQRSRCDHEVSTFLEPATEGLRLQLLRASMTDNALLYKLLVERRDSAESWLVCEEADDWYLQEERLIFARCNAEIARRIGPTLR